MLDFVVAVYKVDIILIVLARWNVCTRRDFTIAFHGADGLHMPLSSEDRIEIVHSIDVERAECFMAEDKAMILEGIEAKHGTKEAFNTHLRAHLLLEPVSHKVDLLQLQTRAADTIWNWVTVDEWMRKVDVRALCIMAGVGEGKSTISAALLEHFRNNYPECVMVAHFLKFSDQRRLEPVRIIKSLAFQLALKYAPLLLSR